MVPLRIPLDCRAVCWLGCLQCDVSGSPTRVCVVSLIGCAEAVQAALSSSSGGIALAVGVNLMCSWKEMSSASSHTAILDQKLPVQ